jgi:transcriptional regulator with XRE-family HTH domain
MKTYGQVIKERRERIHMTMERLAKKAGTHKGYVSGIESHKIAPPSPKVSKRFARVLNIPADTLILLAHCEKAPKEIRDWLRKEMEVFIGPVVGS